MWKCVRVKYAPCYVRKGPVLTQKHTRATRKRQHRERIQCLVLQLIGKQRHLTKLECYRLFGMPLKFFVFPSGAGMQMFVGFPTLEHATYICPCEKHGSQCCHAVCETFPRKDDRLRTSKKVSCKHWGFRHTHTHTHTHTHIHVTLKVGNSVLSFH